MYFGTTSVLEDALNRKQVRWDDVVRNVEYLGMRTRIKVFLGRWYAQWLAPSHARVECRPPVVHEDEEDGYECASDDEMDFDDESDSESSSSSGSDSSEGSGEEYDSDTDVDSDTFLGPATSSLPTRFAMLRKKSLSVSTLKAKKSAILIRPKQQEERREVPNDGHVGDDEDDGEDDGDEAEPQRGRTRNRGRPNAPEHSPKRRRRPA